MPNDPLEGMTQQTAPVHSQLIRKADVVERVGLSSATIWRLQKRGKFPRSFAISPGLVGWLASDIEFWISQRVTDGLTIEYRGAARTK